jgi:hypothetical protein
MLWFVLDNERAVSVFADGDRIYSVTNVIKQRDSGINIDCEEED